MAVALIVAAGRGERLGTGRPKALVTVSGREMLAWSVDALAAVAVVEQIVVALPPDALAAAPPGCLAVAGGAVRSASVHAALAVASDCEDGVVIVHDAARPLATPDLFAAAVRELDRSGADAVVAAAAVTDTIKQVTGDGLDVEQTLDRSRLWAVQTPQVFRRAVLERVLGGASAELLADATDDAWLVERAGGRVRILPASPENIKITTLRDLHLAESLLAQRAAGR